MSVRTFRFDYHAFLISQKFGMVFHCDIWPEETTKFCYLWQFLHFFRWTFNAVDMMWVSQNGRTRE